MSAGKRRAIRDIVALGVLLGYLVLLLLFSSHFYLATEDYEAGIAVRSIGEGGLVGRSTGWPYTPLAPYLYYLYSVIFSDTILGYRMVTVLLILASVAPVYFVFRHFSGAFVALAFTLLSYSLTTFPHPRLEYFVEGSFIAISIFFALRFLIAKKKSSLYLCAFFSVVAFASRGYPHGATLLFLIPLALAASESIADDRVVLSRTVSDWRIGVNAALTRWAASLKAQGTNGPLVALLGLLSVGFTVKFFRDIVHRAALHEYADINDLPSNLPKSSLTWVIMLVLAGSYFFLSYGRQTFTLSVLKSLQSIGSWLTRTYLPLLLPFVLFVLSLLIVGILAGYDYESLMFFLFPTDIFVNQVALQRIGARDATIFLFVVLVATVLFLHTWRYLRPREVRISLFLIILLAGSFARFFPSYNMLYLGAFAVGVSVSIIFPAVGRRFFRRQTYKAVQKSVAVLLVVYGVGANTFLLVRTQVVDLMDGELVRMQQGPLRGIFVERDIVTYFGDVAGVLKGMNGEREKIAFLSSRYLKYVPVVYGYDDVLAGQNLIVGLGRLGSYEEVIKIGGARSNNRLSWKNVVYSWRQTAVERMERSNVRIVVISLYDPDFVKNGLGGSSDPVRQYLEKNFVLAEMIKPRMERYRRSAFPEGALFFTRKEASSAPWS